MLWQQEKQPCYYDFTTPAIAKVLTPQQAEEYQERKRAATACWNDDFQARYGDEIGMEMVLVSIAEYLRYTSFEDTATYCKKCAFLWDTRGVTLCSACRIQYHSRLYAACPACLAKHNEAHYVLPEKVAFGA